MFKEETTKNENQKLILNIFSYITPKFLITTLSFINKQFYQTSQNDNLWKPICLKQWPELIHATSIDQDDFPAWKSCYKRKYKEIEPSLSDLINDKEFGKCEWYSCPNGHLYLIGECSLPILRSKCPTCGVRIGGKHHSMLERNKRLGRVKQYTQGVKNEKKVKFSEISEKILGGRSSVDVQLISEQSQKKKKVFL